MRDGPLVVEAGDPIVVCILTRDKYVNPSSNQSLRLVNAGLRLVEATDHPRQPQSGRGSLAGGSGDCEPVELVAATYKGSGVHEVEYVRELAGRYEACATLRTLRFCD